MFKKIKRVVKGFVRKRIEQIVENVWRNQHMQAIINGEFPQIEVTSSDIAETIMQWSYKQKEPVSFFMTCLSIVGIDGDIILEKLEVRNDEEVFLVKEKKTKKEWKLTLSSNCLEGYLITKKENLEIKYNILGHRHKLHNGMNNIYLTVLEVIHSINLEKWIKIQYCKPKTIIILIHVETGEEISTKIPGIDWTIGPKKWKEALKISEGLSHVSEQEIYNWYCKIINSISKFYNVDDTDIEVTTDTASLTLRNKELIEYEDSIKGICIKNYTNYTYKEYRRDGIEVVWENDTIKVRTTKEQNIKQYIDIAKKGLEEIENLKF